MKQITITFVVDKTNYNAFITQDTPEAYQTLETFFRDANIQPKWLRSKGLYKILKSDWIYLESNNWEIADVASLQAFVDGRDVEYKIVVKNMMEVV